MAKTAALLAGCAAVALVGGTLGYIAINQSPARFADCNTLRVAGADKIGGPFTLVDEAGREVTDKDVITEPSLIYFGYTFCPDVCPLDNVRNADVVDALAKLGHSVTPIFISVDHERDTPETLADFTHYMHDKMIGLTGSPQQIADAALAYRVFYKRRDAEDEFFLYDHTTYTYLVTPDQGFVAAFDRDQVLPAEVMTEQLSCVLDDL